MKLLNERLEYPVPNPYSVIMFTANSTICRSGLVMGAGNAKAIKEYFASLGINLPMELAKIIKPNSVYGCKWVKFRFHNIGAFQTKTDWKLGSTLELIEKSVSRLDRVARLRPEFTFHLPFPGCGHGGLKHEDVLPLLVSLPDNVHVYRG